MVPASGIAEVRIYLAIPDEERYYNQHWVALIEVKGKPMEGEGVAPWQPTPRSLLRQSQELI